jgi:hypothetical protein
MGTFAKIASLLLLPILAQSTIDDIQVFARNEDWQDSGVVLAKGQVARISATGTWGVIDPGKRGKTGPGGNEVDAHDKFVQPGAKEGCLLVRAGDGSVRAFSKNDQVIAIAIPGKISFMANDDRRVSRKHKGFTDNEGHLTVKIVIESP